MRETKSSFETKYDLKEEIGRITDKGYNTVLIRDKDIRDKRRFTKIFDINLNKLIFESDIERKYINFFILLVNTHSRYIEPDLNTINLTVKEIAENLGYSKSYTYDILRVLQRYNIIAYYIKGRNKNIVINPKYYARFYEIKYMYLLENAFDNTKADITDIVDRIQILRNTKNDRKNKYLDEQTKSYLTQYCITD